jgi:5'(3')-deoxyribonucleotidase
MIYVDMDGVLCDFAGAALHVHGRPEIMDNWPPLAWDMHALIGCTEAEFWHKIDARGFAFWANLKPYQWFVDLLGIIAEPFVISTSPSHSHHSSSGKVAWVQMHLGAKFRDYMIGCHKHLLANRDSILIDDNDANCEKFERHGGRAILFPQPWNANHSLCRDDGGVSRLEYVRMRYQHYRSKAA